VGDDQAMVGGDRRQLRDGVDDVVLLDGRAEAFAALEQGVPTQGRDDEDLTPRPRSTPSGP
jgi:hypothetical protein